MLYTSIEPLKVGSGVEIVAPANVYGCVLEDNVFIGPFSEIQRGVVIGARTRVQSHSFVCELVTIGRDCFIGHGVCFINDLLRGGPARGDMDKWRPTVLGDRVSVGSNATILPVNICDDVIVGAGAVVTRDIEIPGTYIGNPAKRLESSNVS